MKDCVIYGHEMEDDLFNRFVEEEYEESDEPEDSR